MGVEFKARAVVLTAGTFLSGNSTSVWKTTMAAALATLPPNRWAVRLRELNPAARPSEIRGRRRVLTGARLTSPN